MDRTRWQESSLGKFGRTVDQHRWEGEEECQVCSHDQHGSTHPMICVDCGVRRIACAEQACPHYWVYHWPDGSRNELIPPCGDKQPDPAREMFDIVRVCQGCYHPLQTDYELPLPFGSFYSENFRPYSLFFDTHL